MADDYNLIKYQILVVFICWLYLSPVRADEIKAATLPKLPPDYQVRSEVNLVKQSRSQSIVEYVQSGAKKRSMTITQDGHDKRYIIDYNTEDLFEISGSICNRKNVTTSRISEGYGLFLIDIYNNAQDKILNYSGVQPVRGIPCMLFTTVGDTLKLDLYFSLQNWTTSTTYPSIPVRAVLHDNGYTIDYYDFYATVVDNPDILETPVNVYCPGRTYTKDLPPLPKSFHFTTKIMNLDINKITTLKIWYDKEKYVVRIDWTPSKLIAPFWTTDPIIELQDFTTGVQYVINQINGNCTVVPMGKLVTLYKQIANGTHPFPDPEYLFQIDANFTYIGLRTVYGFQAEAFQALKDNNIKTIYYAKKQDMMVPILLSISRPDEETGDEIYFDDFTTENLKSSQLDFSACWSNDQILNVRMLFPDMDTTIAEDNPISLSHELRWYLADQLSVTPLRISESTFYNQNSNTQSSNKGVYAIFSMYDRVASIDKFGSVEDSVGVRFRERSLLENISISTCADVCEDALLDVSGMYKDASGFYCSGFNYCATTKQCSLYESDPKIQPLEPGGSCDLRRRTSVLSGFTERKLSTVWSLLQSLVKSRAFRLDLSISGKSSIFTPTVVSEDDSRSYNVTQDMDLQEFTVFLPDTKLLLATGVKDEISVGSCAAACINDPTQLCPVFSLCFTSGLVGQCSLGGFYPDEMPTSYNGAKGCSLYTRNYLTWFEELPGFFPPPPSGYRIMGVPSTEMCAKSCYKVDSGGCDIFYYNPKRYECWTSASLSLDIVGYTGSPVDHLGFKAFSIKHKLNYFLKTNSTQMVDVNGTMVSDMTAEDCAAICKRMGYHSCRRFTRTITGQCRFSNQFTGPTIFDTSSTLYTLKTTSTRKQSTIKPSTTKPLTTTGVGTIVINNTTTTDCQIIKVQQVDFAKVQFNLYKQDTALLSNDATRAEKVGDCMFYCIAETTFQCEAISFCPDNGDCRFSSYHPDLNATILKSQPECQVYARSYVSEYIHSPGTEQPGTADKEDVNIPTADICAKTCSERAEFTCRSFDFCPDTGQCMTWRSHDQQHASNRSQLDTSCSHYSRNYLIDFKKKANHSFTDDVKYELHFGLSLAQCSQQCVEEEEVTCKSFVICPALNQCRILSVHPITNNGAQVIPSQTCDLYTREYYRNGFTPTNKPVTVRTPVCPTSNPVAVQTTPCPTSKPVIVHSSSCPTSSGTTVLSGPQTTDPPETDPGQNPTTLNLTAGTVSGICVSVFVSGVLIGAISCYIIQVVKKRRSNDMEMRLLSPK